MVCTASEWLTAKGERDARLLQHLDASSGSGAKSSQVRSRRLILNPWSTYFPLFLRY